MPQNQNNGQDSDGFENEESDNSGEDDAQSGSSQSSYHQFEEEDARCYGEKLQQIISNLKHMERFRITKHP